MIDDWHCHKLSRKKLQRLGHHPFAEGRHRSQRSKHTDRREPSDHPAQGAYRNLMKIKETQEMFVHGSSVITMLLCTGCYYCLRGMRASKLFPPIHEVPATITKTVVILVDRQFSSKQWLSSDLFQPPTLRSCPRAHRISAFSVVETYELQEYCALASWRRCR